MQRCNKWQKTQLHIFQNGKQSITETPTLGEKASSIYTVPHGALFECKVNDRICLHQGLSVMPSLGGVLWAACFCLRNNMRMLIDGKFGWMLKPER